MRGAFDNLGSCLFVLSLFANQKAEIHFFLKRSIRLMLAPPMRRLRQSDAPARFCSS